MKNPISARRQRWAPGRVSGLLSVVLSGLLAGTSAQAQIVMRDIDRPSGHLGITTGLGATWLVDAKLLDDPNYQYVQTYRSAPIGFTAGYHFNDRNGVQVEVNKIGQGADFQIIDRNDSDKRLGTKKISLTYWSVPLLFKYTGGAAKRVRFEFHTGPQLNLLVTGSDRNEYSASGNIVVVKGKTDQTQANAGTNNRAVVAGTTQVMAGKADFRTSTVGLVFGIGLEFKLFGNFYASGLLRGSYSFNDLRSDPVIDQVKASGYHNDRQSAVLGGQVGLHYQFIRLAEGRPKDRRN